jgi:hypothetical protein
MTFSKTFGFVMIASTLGMIGCGGASVRIAALRPDVDTSQSKVVVLPMLLFDGQKIRARNAEYANPVADERLAAEWSSDLGSGNSMAVSKGVLDAVPGATDGINTLIGNLDATGTLARTTELTSFLQTMSTKFVDGAVAFALVLEDEAEYRTAKVVHVNMGLFDAKTLAWKWVTKGSYSSGLFSADVSYQTAVKNLVGASFAELKARTGGPVR